MKADGSIEGRAPLDRIDVVMDARPSVPGERRRTAARFLLPAVILVAGFVVDLVIGNASDRRVAQELRNRTHGAVVALREEVRNY
jgi:hypothetical protein